MGVFSFISWLIFGPSPSDIGHKGEMRVSKKAMRRLDPEVYQLFDDVTIPTRSGRTTQIDHIILSVYGIFVVETKNYSGWIFGSANNREWTQIVYQEKNRFQNPLRQNYGHICALSDALGIPKRKFHNVVCFAGGAEFKTEMPEGVHFDTTYVGYIKSFHSTLLSKEELRVARKKIESGRLEPGRETTRLHVQNLREPSRKTQGMKCSRCGKPMVLRTARKGKNAGGQFWGCSGYPQCRHTVSAV